jgi:hypothetical protein
MNKRLIVVITLWCVTFPASAIAQKRMGFRAYATYGSNSLGASHTFDAVAGKARQQGLGGGIAATSLWRGLFIELGMSRTRLNGERVYVDGTSVFKLGIPMQITLTPIDVAAGWRTVRHRVSPYVGGGLTSLSYKETGGFSQAGDDVTVRKTGPLVLAGADVRILKWVYLGGEARYRAVKGILGKEGVSKAFGEDRIGGLSAGVRLSLGK